MKGQFFIFTIKNSLHGLTVSSRSNYSLGIMLIKYSNGILYFQQEFLYMYSSSSPLLALESLPTYGFPAMDWATAFTFTRYYCYSQQQSSPHLA